MSEPIVSIVIPCFNGGAYLLEALTSLSNQTFRDFETIIIDDGSTDQSTISLLKSLPPDIRVIRQGNLGLPAARNAGMSSAVGRYLLPLDCDDRLEPEFLAEGVKALECHPEASFVFAQMRLTGDLSGTTRKFYNPFGQLFLNQLPYCLLMRREVWARAAGYDENMRQGYEDWEFNIRLAGMGHHGFSINKPLFIYRVSDKGMLNSVSRRCHGGLWRRIQKRHAARYRPTELWRQWRQWRLVPLPYPPLLLLALLLAHRLMPETAFNALYARLLAWSASKRAAGAS